MLMKILPIILALIGLLGGGAAGYFLRPPPPPPEEVATEGGGEHGAGADAGHAAPKADAHAADTHGEEGDGHEAEPTTEFVKLNNQFVVPVINGGQVASLVVLSLSLEVTLGSTEKVYAAEPKIRDSLLQVLFDHANAGGFNGAFTDTATMADLRRTMLEAVRMVIGDAALGVLVSDIVRQDTK
ncbi:flagellar basal body-associated protein FliL [Rhodobacter sp. JA431]|uniref:flagellar basal body-associated FliL family protein n=1 Tax=Rhodobacter sp. JA431 TaxID=570013 RepID=UPI000BD0C769|nr:flagellar basal body-associated FliL family protein [Rhodobacter sp. JA431]SOC07661.1 flagellar basal body-associated protein FliL [Rhodobacter sp. JA431]